MISAGAFKEVLRDNGISASGGSCSLKDLLESLGLIEIEYIDDENGQEIECLSVDPSVKHLIHEDWEDEDISRKEAIDILRKQRNHNSVARRIYDELNYWPLYDDDDDD